MPPVDEKCISTKKNNDGSTGSFTSTCRLSEKLNWIWIGSKLGFLGICIDIKCFWSFGSKIDGDLKMNLGLFWGEESQYICHHLQKFEMFKYFWRKQRRDFKRLMKIKVWEDCGVSVRLEIIINLYLYHPDESFIYMFWNTFTRMFVFHFLSRYVTMREMSLWDLYLFESWFLL